MAANGEELTEGALSKWTNKINGWQYRWFVLDSKGGYMSYYTVSYRSVHRTPSWGELTCLRGSARLLEAKVGAVHCCSEGLY